MKFERVPLLAACAAALMAFVWLGPDLGSDTAAVPAVRRDKAVPGPTAAKPGSTPPVVARAPGARPADGLLPDVGLHPLSGLGLGELTETLQRPLFEPTRRPQQQPKPPPVLAQAPAAPAAGDITSFRLVGVMLSDDDAVAVLTLDGARPVRVEKGDFVAGWEVVAITPTEVTLARGGRREALKSRRR